MRMEYTVPIIVGLILLYSLPAVFWCGSEYLIQRRMNDGVRKAIDLEHPDGERQKQLYYS
jgi:hypothetical protein